MISERPNNPRGRNCLRNAPGFMQRQSAFIHAVRHQHIAHAANRLQVERQLGVFLDLAAQARHLHVDGSLQRHTQPGAKIAARKRMPGMGGEQLQQRGFAAGQLHRLAVAGEARGARIEQRRPPSSPAGCRRLPAARRGATAAQPQQQLARLKRLGQIIVDAQFQAGDAVGGLAPRGQHQDRHGGLPRTDVARSRPDSPGIITSRSGGRTPCPSSGRGPRRRPGGADAEAVGGQIALQQGAQPLVIVHHQQMGLVRTQAGNSWLPCPAVEKALPPLRFSRPPC